MRIHIPALALAASLGFSSHAGAITALLPHDSRFSGGILLEKVDYSGDNNVSPSSDNQMLVLGYKHMLNKQFGLGAGVGLLLDGKFGDGDKISGGNGFRLALDGDFQFMQSGANHVIGTFGLNLDQFKYNQNGVTENLNMTDLMIGALVRHQLGKIALHGGLDLYLMSNGRVKTSTPWSSFTTNLQRDSKFDIRLGATFAATPTTDLRLDLLLFGEQTILLGCDIHV